MRKEEITELSRSLPQLYRFCFLMTGEAAKALEAFQNTLREAALLAARRQLPEDRLWSFHEARHQCIELTKNEVKPESDEHAEQAITADAPGRVAQLEPSQLAAWIAAAPEPQRSALAFFYLNQFSHREMQNLLDVKMEELASLISHGRAQFQAWLNDVTAENCARMKGWLSRRKRALLECAPISDRPPNDRAMRSAIESARTIPEAAASLTTQQQFDQALARLVAEIEIPKAAEEWFVNVALIKGVKRSWKKTARHPAILATALAVLVMAGLTIYFVLEQLHEFPGSVIAKKMLVVASTTKRGQLDPLQTDAINLGDYFFMKFQLEHFDVPMAFADLRATGARVVDDDEGHRVAQVALAESGLQFFLYPADAAEAAEATKSRKPGWNFVENEGWTGAVEVRGDVCFMIALRGSKADLEPYLANRQK